MDSENSDDSQYDARLAGIVELVGGIRSQLNATLPDISQIVSSIIDSNYQNQNVVEHLLDNLLDYGYMGVGESEFKRLNSFYATFNKEGARDYAQFYAEILEDN